jgi:hypothetical protein
MNIFLSLLLLSVLSFNNSFAQAASSAPPKIIKESTSAPLVKQSATQNLEKKSNVPSLVKQNKLRKDPEFSYEDDFIFYIAPYIGFGAFLTNAIQLANYPYLSGELRMGFRVSEKFYTMFSVETGFNIKDRSYPTLTNIIVAPEFYITKTLSSFAGLGVGILTANTNITSAILTETRAGFAWKAGLNWQAVKWGEKEEYVFPISITYSGAKTKWVTCHTIMLSVGFMFFN